MTKSSTELNAYANGIKALFQDVGAPNQPTAIQAKTEVDKYVNQVDTLLTVCDFWKGDLQQANGFADWLGIADNAVTKAQLIQSIHPQHRLLYMAKSLAVYKTLQNFKGFIRTNGAFAYALFFPVQMKDGSYFHVKQLSMPLRLDEQGQMVQQLNIYRIIEPFRGQVATSNFLSFQGNDFALSAMKEGYKANLLQEINDKESPFYRRKFLPFSPRQFEMMTNMIKNPDWKIGQIATDMGLAPKTGQDYSKDILKLAKKAFPTLAFHQTRAIVMHLFNMDVI